ncbi:hypothetical protein E1283_12180 [Streptomyces hainanensis]|uniref:Uncharacterized protein n=1 Tax=Streptomyces hainanensis TaxID=402648 RepID=A0A4R4TDV1_9ACTN|nr:hypothetical protein E1283_12180 [Streptomyces hainanensis]
MASPGRPHAEGARYTVRRYPEQPPTAAESAEVPRRLRLEPRDIARLTGPCPRRPGARRRRRGGVGR